MEGMLWIVLGIQIGDPVSDVATALSSPNLVGTFWFVQVEDVDIILGKVWSTTFLPILAYDSTLGLNCLVII